MDKIKRKIVHKIAERFCILRDVMIKPNDLGDMTLTKNEASKVPSITLPEIMNRKKLEKEKNNSDMFTKRKIFTRNKGNENNFVLIIHMFQVQNPEANAQKQNEKGTIPSEEEFEIQKKNEKYEEAKKRIITGKAMNPVNDTTNDKNKINKIKSRPTTNSDTNYDPDYNRNLNRPAPQPQIYQQMAGIPQPMMQNPMMIPQQTNFQNPDPFSLQTNNSQNFRPFGVSPPMYQNFPVQNPAFNNINYQNNNQPVSNFNMGFNQFGYNNYNNFVVNNNPPLITGVYQTQQQSIFPPQMLNQNFSDGWRPAKKMNDNYNNNVIGLENNKKQAFKENKFDEKLFNDKNFPSLEKAKE